MVASDLVGTAEDVVAVDQTSRAQRDDAVDRVDECHCAADLVPAQRVQVRHVSEEGAHQVADERGALFGHPDRERVRGLAAGCRVQLESASPHSNAWLSMNDDVSTGSGGMSAALASTSMKAPQSFMMRRT